MRFSYRILKKGRNCCGAYDFDSRAGIHDAFLPIQGDVIARFSCRVFRGLARSSELNLEPRVIDYVHVSVVVEVERFAIGQQPLSRAECADEKARVVV